MMKKALPKRFTGIASIALLLALALCSCVGYSAEAEGLGPYALLSEQLLAVPLKSIADAGEVSGSLTSLEAAFHSFESGGERLEKLSADALLSYESPRADASAFFYKSLLRGDMLLPYMAALYALDNGFERAYFSSDTLSVEDVYKSYSFLTCDNPFFESNYGISLEYLTPAGGDAGARVYYCLRTTALEPARLSKKLAAYEKAKEIVSTMPPGLTEEQRAEYLYRYVVEHVSYIDYDRESGQTQDYLHDALVLERSNCDGYANAVSMLFNLARIPCTIAIGDDRGEGHAWATARLGGFYYHFDATYDSETALKAAYGNRLFYFRLSDEAAFSLSRRYDRDIFADAPKCLDKRFDDAAADLKLSSFSLDESLLSVAAALEDDIKNDDGSLVVAAPSLLGADWEELDGAFNAVAGGVNINGTVDAYLIDDRGMLILYGAAG